MSSKSVLKSKPLQLLSNLFPNTIGKNTTITKLTKYAPNQTLTNGTKGQNVLLNPKLLFPVYVKQLPKALESSFFATFTMFGWCWAVMTGSDIANNAPLGFQRTSTMRIVKYGDKPVVEFIDGPFSDK